MVWDIPAMLNSGPSTTARLMELVFLEPRLLTMTLVMHQQPMEFMAACRCMFMATDPTRVLFLLSIDSTMGPLLILALATSQLVNLIGPCQAMPTPMVFASSRSMLQEFLRVLRHLLLPRLCSLHLCQQICLRQRQQTHLRLLQRIRLCLLQRLLQRIRLRLFRRIRLCLLRRLYQQIRLWLCLLRQVALPPLPYLASPTLKVTSLSMSLVFPPIPTMDLADRFTPLTRTLPSPHSTVLPTTLILVRPTYGCQWTPSPTIRKKLASPACLLNVAME